MPHTAAVFAAVALMLYLGHHVGHIWAATLHRRLPGPPGPLHHGTHLTVTTSTKLMVLIPGALVLALPIAISGVILAVIVDAMSQHLVMHSTRPGPLVVLHHPRTGSGMSPRHTWHLTWTLISALIIAGFSA